MAHLTLTAVAARLGISRKTAQAWRTAGRFPNAVKQVTPRGAVWMVPESDLEGLELPTMGRPRKGEYHTPRPVSATARVGSAITISHVAPDGTTLLGSGAVTRVERIGQMRVLVVPQDDGELRISVINE